MLTLFYMVSGRKKEDSLKEESFRLSLKESLVIFQRLKRKRDIRERYAYNVHYIYIYRYAIKALEILRAHNAR